MENFDHIKSNIETIRKNISGYGSSVRILGVSKTFPAEAVRAAAEAGLDEFGESKLQEAREKLPLCEGLGIRWHFIGHLQSNKAAKVSQLFDCIQSVDSVELAAKISASLAGSGRTLDIMLELKVSQEETKFGIDPEGIYGVVEGVKGMPGITVTGIMAMAPYFDEAEASRPFFKKAREVFDNIRKQGPEGNLRFETLSMGMSHDYMTAIEEGSTMVRIGTAIFGKREP